MNSEEFNKDQWQLEEYKLLSSHYFHEDNYFLQSMTIYTALNTALIAISSSNYFSSNTDLIEFGVPVFGITSCVIWLISLIRVRHLRRQVELRIKELEMQCFKKQQLSLKIRNRENTGRTIWSSLPVSILLRIFPIVIGSIWLIMLIYKIKLILA
jgi:hypothetical protein